MRGLGFFLVPLVAVLVVCASVLELRSQYLTKEAVALTREFRDELKVSAGASVVRNSRPESSAKSVSATTSRDETLSGGPRSLQVEFRTAESAAARARDWWFGNVRSLTNYALLLRVAAEAEGKTESQVPLYCEALATLGEALRREPRNARALMQWANIRQVLGSISCGRPHTDGDFKAAITRALELDPTDADAQYAAGQILRWARADTEATALFNRVLRYQPRISSLQARQIYSSIHDAQALSAIVPPRFPQILAASQYFSSHPVSFGEDRAAAANFQATLVSLQQAAIQKSVDEFSAGKIPFAMHIDRLTQLTDVAASNAVRQTLDQWLSSLLARRGEAELSQYLAARVNWQELEVVPATLAGDTRPLRSPLTGWGSVDSFFADEFYRTVGFFLPENQGVHSIELIFNQRPSSAYLSALRLYVSPDNQNWSEVALVKEVSSFALGSRHLVVLQVPVRTETYWKVHFANAARERQLLGNLKTSTRVYGRSARVQEPALNLSGQKSDAQQPGTVSGKKGAA